ncbi:hypothetical protein [Pararhizobium sp.]|uniref:hypothetical protein n=1 Tax=Pararhizobium sp. TaxID=1977563 RepID=UPI003D0AA69B
MAWIVDLNNVEIKPVSDVLIEKEAEALKEPDGQVDIRKALENAAVKSGIHPTDMGPVFCDGAEIPFEGLYWNVRKVNRCGVTIVPIKRYGGSAVEDRARRMYETFYKAVNVEARDWIEFAGDPNTVKEADAWRKLAREM